MREPQTTNECRFLSTPSARRATGKRGLHQRHHPISIHALREEGDYAQERPETGHGDFYPRPPRGGRRSTLRRMRDRRKISIHALREEGDVHLEPQESPLLDFYPRPPRGGRLARRRAGGRGFAISIHALREEGDEELRGASGSAEISIHALREEGDRDLVVFLRNPDGFLSTPSARRATGEDPEGFAELAEFLSTPSARRATTKP